jgi:hypothetical protein
MSDGGTKIERTPHRLGGSSVQAREQASDDIDQLMADLKRTLLSRRPDRENLLPDAGEAS